MGNRLKTMLQIRCLGVPEIIVDGAPVTETLSGKAQAILYYVAVTNRPGLIGALLVGLSKILVRAHRPSALASINRIVALHDGRVIADGDRDDVIAELRGRARTTAKPSSDEPEKQEPSRHVAEAG